MKRKLSSWQSIVIAYFEGGKMSPSLVEFNQNNFFFQRDCLLGTKAEN